MMKYYLALFISVFTIITSYGQISNANVKARVLLYDEYWKDKDVQYLDSAFDIITAVIKQYPDNIEIAKDYL